MKRTKTKCKMAAKALSTSFLLRHNAGKALFDSAAAPAAISAWHRRGMSIRASSIPLAK